MRPDEQPEIITKWIKRRTYTDDRTGTKVRYQSLPIRNIWEIDLDLKDIPSPSVKALSYIICMELEWEEKAQQKEQRKVDLKKNVQENENSSPQLKWDWTEASFIQNCITSLKKTNKYYQSHLNKQPAIEEEVRKDATIKYKHLNNANSV